MYNIVAYSVYLICSLVVVLWVGRILHRNGKAYLFEECPDKSVSEAANNILYVCYCLLNAGFAFYDLNTCNHLSSLAGLLEFLASSEGFLLLVLGFMHIINLLFAPKVISLFISKKQFTEHSS